MADYEGSVLDALAFLPENRPEALRRLRAANLRAQIEAVVAVEEASRATEEAEEAVEEANIERRRCLSKMRAYFRMRRSLRARAPTSRARRAAPSPSRGAASTSRRTTAAGLEPPPPPPPPDAPRPSAADFASALASIEALKDEVRALKGALAASPQTQALPPSGRTYAWKRAFEELKEFGEWESAGALKMACNRAPVGSALRALRHKTGRTGVNIAAAMSMLKRDERAIQSVGSIDVPICADSYQGERASHEVGRKT